MSNLGAEELRTNASATPRGSEETMEQVRQRAQEYADQTQSVSTTYCYADDGSVLELRCYPKATYGEDKEAPEVPDDAVDGHLRKTADGKYQRAWAVPVALSADGDVEEEGVYDLHAGGEDGSVPDHIAQFAGSRRRRGFRYTYVKEGAGEVLSPEAVREQRTFANEEEADAAQLVYYPVEVRWKDVELDYEPGAAPTEVVHEEL